MTTIIFVHGTGVRQDGYVETLKYIEKKLQEYLPDTQLNLVPCLWGVPCGVHLRAEGISIPGYKETRLDNAFPTADFKTQEWIEEVQWSELYRDPLHEIRYLSCKEFLDSIYVQEEIQEQVQQLPGEELRRHLQLAGMGSSFEQACQEISCTTPYLNFLRTASEQTIDEYYAAIARALVARMTQICREVSWSSYYDPVLSEPSFRQQTVDLIVRDLTENLVARGAISDRMVKIYLGLGKVYGTKYARAKRGLVTDETYPMAGDILLYQARGEEIRNFIYQQIKQVQARDSQIVLLAHSLGGIACVDLLVKESIKSVELLITVGSQAPFLYEINALPSLKFGEKLPDTFPKHWLNIYDDRDFLSYLAEGIFTTYSTNTVVKDECVDNKYFFPDSHSKYWSNPEVWEKIIDKLRVLKLV